MNDNLAIMGLKDIRDYLIECNYNVEAIDYAIKAIEKETKLGHWIVHQTYTSCSNCCKRHPFVYYHRPYCDTCGIKMAEEPITLDKFIKAQSNNGNRE